MGENAAKKCWVDFGIRIFFWVGSIPKPLKELGEHPENGGAVNVMDGRYGPYVKWEKINATLPKDIEPASLTMEMAMQLISEKSAKKGTKRKAPAKKVKAK